MLMLVLLLLLLLLLLMLSATGTKKGNFNQDPRISINYFFISNTFVSYRLINKKRLLNFKYFSNTISTRRRLFVRIKSRHENIKMQELRLIKSQSRAGVKADERVRIVFRGFIKFFGENDKDSDKYLSDQILVVSPPLRPPRCFWTLHFCPYLSEFGIHVIKGTEKKEKKVFRLLLPAQIC